MLSITSQATPLAGHLVAQTVADATPNNNVIGGAGTLHMIDVDNTANGSPVYLKIWDSAAPTVGTTPADYVLRVPASVRRVVAIIEGFDFTNLSFACVTTAAQAGVTSPPLAVIARLLTS